MRKTHSFEDKFPRAFYLSGEKAYSWSPDYRACQHDHLSFVLSRAFVGKGKEEG